MTVDLRAMLGILEAAAEQDYAAMSDEERAWDKYTDELKQEHGRSQHEPPTPEREGWLKTRLLAGAAALLFPDERLVECFLDGDQGHVFLLEPNGRVHHAPLGAPIGHVRSLVERAAPADHVILASVVASREAKVQAILRDLYQALLAPVENLIRGKGPSAVRRLIVVPHGLLSDIPFAPLWAARRETYLIPNRRPQCHFHALGCAPRA